MLSRSVNSDRSAGKGTQTHPVQAKGSCEWLKVKRRVLSNRSKKSSVKKMSIKMERIKTRAYQATIKKRFRM